MKFVKELFTQGELEGDDKMKKAHKHNVYRLSSLQFAYQRRERIMNLTLVTSYKSSSCLYRIRFQ